MTGRDPVVLLVFDQAVEPGAVAAAARITSGDEGWPVRPVALPELEAHDPRMAEAARRAEDSVWVALRPVRPLPPARDMVFRLDEGLPSREGPRPAGRVQELRFRVRGPLEVAGTPCPEPRQECRPSRRWWVDFTNPLDTDQNPAERVAVRPEVEGLRVSAAGDRLWLFGDFRPHTTYHVRIDGELRDPFGQTLGDPAELEAHFGAPRPFVAIPGRPFVALDPAAGHRLEVATLGIAEVDVAVYGRRAEEWTGFRAKLEDLRHGMPPQWNETEAVARWTARPEGAGTGFALLPLDLSPVFREGWRHAVVVLSAPRAPGEPEGPTNRNAVAAFTWVQATSFAVGAVWDPGELVGWAVSLDSLDDGTPLEGVEIALPAPGLRASTDGDGLARLPLDGAADSLLTARRGDETAILPALVAHRGRWGWMAPSPAWRGDASFPAPAWFSLTDRGLYRPGEALEGHGWIRALSGDPRRDLAHPREVDSVRWEVRSARNRTVADGTVPVSSTGAFHLVADLPPEMRSGRASIELVALVGGEPVEGWSHRTPFRVEEFRRPAYEVTGEVDPGPHLAEDVVEATARGVYYDGAPLQGSPVTWRASTAPTAWSPPGWRGWRFGGAPLGEPRFTNASGTLEGETGGDGRHVLRVGTGAPRHPVPVRLALRTQVLDVNRQAGSTSLGTVVHPARRAAGLRLDRRWVKAGEEVAFDVVAVDLEGAPTPATVPEVRAFLEPDSSRPGSADTDQPVALTCQPGEEEQVARQPVRPLRCGVRPDAPGTYRVEAEVRDPEGRASLTAQRLYVLSSTYPWMRSPAREGLVATPDRERYRPGDTARIMLAAPFYPMEGLATVVRHGIRSVEPLRLEGPGEEVAVPIHDSDAGGVDVRIDLSASSGGSADFSVWSRLPVELDARRLDVAVAPDREVVAPGDTVTVDVAVTDASGAAAAGGEVALWLVDEAILALRGYRLGDPLEALHGRRHGDRPQLFLPHGAVRWVRRPRGPGIVTAELLEAATGAPPLPLRVFLDGEDRGVVERGRLLLADVPPGSHLLLLRRGDEPVLERTIEVPAEGLDLGMTVVGVGVMPPQIELPAPGAALALRARVDVTIAATPLEGEGDLSVQDLSPPGAAASDDPVEVRTLFRALAAFEPAVRLDENGRARVAVRLPDTMTRYRILAVASHGATRFGTAEGTVSTTRDLVVRASPPRFLHPDDRPELPVVVQNASDGTMEVEVAARTVGMPLQGDRGFRVRLPAGGRTELRFAARAGGPEMAELEMLGVARGSGGEVTDAVGVPVPVRPALAPRAVAVHERVEAGESLRLDLETPPDAYPGFGGVEVGLSTTLLQPLAEVLRSLCLAPLYWPEPTAARVLGLAALDGALETIRAPDLPSASDLRAHTEADVSRLVAWMRPYLYGGGSADPQRGFVSRFSRVHAAHALHIARGAGYESIRDSDLGAAGRMVRGIWDDERERLRDAATRRPLTGWSVATAAYALHVGWRMEAVEPGPEVREWVEALEPADLPVEVLAWLLGPVSALPEGPALRPGLLRELENRALTTGATVTFRQGGRTTAEAADSDVRRLVLASDRRSDAAVLAALVDELPGHRLLPGLVRGLLGPRDGTGAGGAHENGWVLLALGRWASVMEAEPADLAVDVHLGGRPFEAFEEGLRLGGRERTALASAPLPAPGRPTTLEVAGEGRGTLHVRAGVRYAPLVTPDLPAQDRGFLVSRRYEAVDDPDDVHRGDDGTWRIRAGARVRVRLTFTAPARRYRVQLRDPLPAGLEVVNPNLYGIGFTTGPGSPRQISPPRGRVAAPLAATLFNFPYGWEWMDLLFRWRAWRGSWATHEELRDDRMDAYTPYLPAGTYESTYLVRATTPGTFLAAPPRVDETEHPETFGQGTPDRVRVVPGG